MIPENQPEGLLRKRCLQGDPEAWDELFAGHYGATGRFVFQLGPELVQEDVEEILQETFLSVIKNLPSFKGNSQFQTWIFRIAVNKTRDYRDRRQAAKRGGGQTPVSLQAEDPETGLTLDVPSAALGPEATLLKVEEAQLLDKALSRLDEPCREVIQLRYFADLSYDEISQALGLNIKTVSSRLSKCLDRLEEIARRVFAEGKPAASPSKK